MQSCFPTTPRVFLRRKFAKRRLPLRVINAALVLCLASGLEPENAVQLANAAAGIVVGWQARHFTG